MKDDLQEKLKNISAPRIELTSHRQALRRTLLASRYFQPKPGLFWAKRLAPVGAALILVLFFASPAIYAKVQESRAMGIAKNDSELQKLDLDFAKVKMVAKPTRLPSSEPAVSAVSIGVAVSPTVSSSASSSLPVKTKARPVKPNKDDKIMSVEFDDGKSKYTVLVNLTKKRVEKIKKESESDDYDKEKEQASATPPAGRPNQNEDKPETSGNERWQSPGPSPALKEESREKD